MTRLDFDSVEEICLNYWSSKEFSSIYSLNSVENFVMNCDYELYEQVVKKLIPDILSPITGLDFFFRNKNKNKIFKRKYNTINSNIW
jgi:hypothetical protein